MSSKTNTSLSIFISELRSKPKEIFYKNIIKEKRKMALNSELTVLKLLKLVYFLINNIDVDVMEFVKACASPILEIKKIGYLGLSISENDKILILLVNTLMNDLKSLESREYALNFICNININQKNYTDLSDYICISKNLDKNIAKCVVSKNKLTGINSMNIVGNTDKLIFVKIQIIYDKLCSNENFFFNENDLLFIISLYPTIKCQFLKIKLVQIYEKLFKMEKLIVTSKFYKELENDIIVSSEKFKPIKCIALAYEISRLFLMTSHITQKVEHFVFRLINSKNPNSRYMGFNLSIKFNFLTSKTIDRSIKLGINIKYSFKALHYLINKNTYNEVYKRREEIRFVLDKNRVLNEKSEKLFYKILIKIQKYFNDELYLKILYDYPNIIYYTNTLRTISETNKKEFCTKLLTQQHFRYFTVFYCFIHTDLINHEFYKEIFLKHLNIIINEKSTKKILVLEKLIFTFCKLNDDLNYYRDHLYNKYMEIFHTDINNVLLYYLKNGIILMNSKCSNKLIWLKHDKFISLTLKEKLHLNCDQTIILNRVKDNKNKYINFCKTEKNYYTIENVSKIYIDLTLIINNEKLNKRIFI